jgi:predicted phosphodiesterase
VSPEDTFEAPPRGLASWSGGALEIGLNRPLHVREERLATRHDACRLLYVSDIHLRRRRAYRLCRQIVDSVACSHPDVVLLGGDLVDRAIELTRLSQLVRELREFAPVLAIGGNHDRRVGLIRVRDAVCRGGGEWIHDRTACVTHGRRVISVAGPEAVPHVRGDVRVLCAHCDRRPVLWRHIGVLLAGRRVPVPRPLCVSLRC